MFQVSNYLLKLCLKSPFPLTVGVVVRSPPIGPDKSDKYPRYRVAVQTPPIHPGIFGLILPWLGSGLSAKLSMLVYNNIAAMIGISRDKSQEQNRIGIDAEGNPVVYYTITEHDKPMLLAGLEAQMRLMYAAGATHIFPVHEKMDWHYCHGEEPLETYIQRVKDQGIEANRMQVRRDCSLALLYILIHHF